MHILLALFLFVQADDLDSLKKKFTEEKTQTYSKRYSTIGKIGGLKTDEAATKTEGVEKAKKNLLE